MGLYIGTLHISSLVGFLLVALGMVLTPGPNMVYLVSRAICQGRRAELVSLGGVAGPRHRSRSHRLRQEAGA